MKCQHHRIKIAPLEGTDFADTNGPLTVFQWCANPENEKYGPNSVAMKKIPVDKRLFCDGDFTKKSCPLLNEKV